MLESFRAQVHTYALDRLPQSVQWIQFGIGIMGAPMGIVSLILNVGEILILKGVQAPFPVLAGLFVVGMIVAFGLGWSWEKYGFWGRMNDRVTKVQTPYMKDILDKQLALFPDQVMLLKDHPVDHQMLKDILEQQAKIINALTKSGVVVE